MPQLLISMQDLHLRAFQTLVPSKICLDWSHLRGQSMAQLPERYTEGTHHFHPEGGVVLCGLFG